MSDYWSKYVSATLIVTRKDSFTTLFGDGEIGACGIFYIPHVKERRARALRSFKICGDYVLGNCMFACLSMRRMECLSIIWWNPPLSKHITTSGHSKAPTSHTALAPLQSNVPARSAERRRPAAQTTFVGPFTSSAGASPASTQIHCMASASVHSYSRSTRPRRSTLNTLAVERAPATHQPVSSPMRVTRHRAPHDVKMLMGWRTDSVRHARRYGCSGPSRRADLL